MTTKEKLIEARALIANPAYWWDGLPHHASAGAHCALTALGKVGAPDAAYIALRNAIRQITGKPYGFISRFNDEHNHAKVIEAFDCAIAQEGNAQ